MIMMMIIIIINNIIPHHHHHYHYSVLFYTLMIINEWYCEHKKKTFTSIIRALEFGILGNYVSMRTSYLY